MALQEGTCDNCGEKSARILAFTLPGVEGRVRICKRCVADTMDTDLCFTCGRILDGECRNCCEER